MSCHYNAKDGPYIEICVWIWLAMGCMLAIQVSSGQTLGPVLLMLLRHVARILANGSAAFFESCDAIGWNSCDMSQKR